MADISALPILRNIDGGDEPQLARVLRDKIESGVYGQGDILPAAGIAHGYNVSVRITNSTLAMLAANRYVSRPGACTPYSAVWQVRT